MAKRDARGTPIPVETDTRFDARGMGRGTPTTPAPVPVAAPVVEPVAAPSNQQLNPEYEAAVEAEMAAIAAEYAAPPPESEFLEAPGIDYRQTPGFQNIMGTYGPYAEMIGTPSYEAIKDPIQQYQQMLEQGVDVTGMAGYQDMLKERMRAVNQGFAGAGALYSGRRGQALGEVGGGLQREFADQYMGRQRDIAGVMSGIEAGRMDRFGNLTSQLVGSGTNFYNNYMNLLQNLGSPQTATSLAGMGMDQGLAMGQQNIGAQTQASQFNLQGVGAENAALADFMKGGANIYNAYQNRMTPTTTVSPTVPYTGGYQQTPVPQQQQNYMEEF